MKACQHWKGSSEKSELEGEVSCLLETVASLEACLPPCSRDSTLHISQATQPVVAHYRASHIAPDCFFGKPFCFACLSSDPSAGDAAGREAREANHGHSQTIQTADFTLSSPSLQVSKLIEAESEKLLLETFEKASFQHLVEAG